jgi:hypothetical protein
MPVDERPDDQVLVTTRGFVSDRVERTDSEWPPTWAIVRVAPSGWMATIPVGNLTDALNSRAVGAYLNGLQYRWESDRLVLELGPAHVVGDREQWRSWVRRLVDAADSAAGLYESPRPYPWDGPVALVEVEQVHVPGIDAAWP